MSTFEDPDIINLYTKIRNNPHYLEVPNEMPFVESPLHTAALEGRTDLALEILRLKPSLGKKLNLDGLSPLHLALGNGHTNTVKRLVKHDPDLVRVPGREGNTLLHYAVEKEEIDLLIYFLIVCPLSIFDVTVRDETAAHIAVRNNNLRAFMVLFGWARRTFKMMVFRWRNEDGNNVMHLAALTNQPEVMKSLIRYVNVNKKNLAGKTALDILKPEDVEAREILIRKGAKEGSSLVDDATSCEKYLKSNPTTKDCLIQFGAWLDHGWSGNMRNAVLVVSVLVATAAFQAVLTPPMGIYHNDTTPVFDTNSTNSTSTNFNNKTLRITKISMIYNTIAFGLAVGMCLIIQPFEWVPWLSLSLFSGSYAAVAYEIYPGTEAPFILVGAVLTIILSFLIILPWKAKILKGLVRGDNYYEYNLDEVKYLIFSSTDLNEGLVLKRIANRKASQ